MEIATAIILGAVLTNIVGVAIYLIPTFHKRGEHKGKVDINEKSIERHSRFDGRISTIEGALRVRKESIVESGSPLKLTDKGTVLLVTSGADKYIEKNKESLLKQFNDITEPYDIQKRAGEVMREELEHDKDIKDFVFRKGEFMEDVADVASIALRNVVFKHKGIDIEKYKD